MAKINEQALVKIVHSSDIPMDIYGWLYMKDKVGPRFHERWCVVKGNLFFYFEEWTDRKPIGVILLAGPRLNRTSKSDQRLFTFQIEFVSKEQTSAGQPSAETLTYVFGAESEQEVDRWLSALGQASQILASWPDLLVQASSRPLESSDASGGEELSDPNPSTSDISARALDRPFAEIHEFFGRQFKEYLEQNKANKKFNK